MKFFELKMRLIAPVVVVCFLVSLGSQVGHSQGTPTTGALLTINGTVDDGYVKINVSLSVSDKDIHSGNAQTVPTTEPSNCTLADKISTDAYVMQAGAPTGCDPGHYFEGNLSDGSFTFSSPEGSPVRYEFRVTTHYQCVSDYLGTCNASKSNTSGTISSNDTSFMTVFNDGYSSFNGTINLAASSPFCGTSGLVFDSFTGTLPGDSDASATLALAQDASGCGGFTSLSQTQTLEPGVQSIYKYFNDEIKITPLFNTGGESLRITFVPVRYSAFTPPPNFPDEACIPPADISPTDPNAPLGTDVCGLYQEDCSFGGVKNAGDCTTLHYTARVSYDLPPNLPAIGGPDALIAHTVGCPNSGVNAESIFLSYSVTRNDPSTDESGDGTGSCDEVTYTPGAPVITGAGTTTTRLVAWKPPVHNSRLNEVQAGAVRPLKFEFSDILGNAVTNLSLCNAFTVTDLGKVCSDSPAVPTPWVNLASFGIVCPDGTPINPATDTTTLSFPGQSDFLNNGDGSYELPWKTQKDWKGSCANVKVTFNSGLVAVPATKGFRFK